MSTVPFALRLLMIEVGAATPFYPSEPQFRGRKPEADATSSANASDTVAA